MEFKIMKTEVLLEEKKVITIGNLNNTDHVGFIEGDYKGYVSVSVNRRLLAVASENTDTEPISPTCSYGGKSFKDISELIRYIVSAFGITTIYRFDTRKELYQWLGE